MTQLKHWLFLSTVALAATTQAQFAPQVGNPGTTAIHKDSTIIKGWATGCTLNRGWQNIADTSMGKAQVGDETYIPGPAANGVASLGDGGEAIVTFLYPVVNGSGYDFAVFENGFIDQSLDPGTAFLELAFVEVSSDGEHFVRFNAVCNNDTFPQLAGGKGMDASKLNNLAGKYIGGYGTPFDLEELKDKPNLDVNNITHIKVIDVIGCIQNQYASRDSAGHKINDPWPTPFASSGFDLDAVGVINHNAAVFVTEVLSAQTVDVYPNPAAINNEVMLTLPGSAQNATIAVYDLLGKEVFVQKMKRSENQTILSFSQQGIYYLVINDSDASVSKKIVIR
jgi:hypothetical protein